MAYYTTNQSNMRTSAPTQNGQGYQRTQLPHQQFYQPEQLATPFFGQQNYSQPYQVYQPQQMATPLSGQQNNSQPIPFYQPQQLATPLFGQQNNYSQPSQFYQPQQLATPHAAYAETEREASVTSLDIGIKEDTTGSSESQQSSTLTNEGHMEVPAQTANVIPHPKTVAGYMPDLPKYKMDRSPRGICLIFNAENFTVEHLKKRTGTEKDVEALLNTFQNNLKFKTEVKNDPTAQEYIDCLKAIRRMDHSEYDCFACIILSHGSNGHVCGTDGVEVSINTLTGLFRGDRAPSLVDKPKLFFIQACQGAYRQEAVDIIQQDGPTSLPNVSDTLVSHATIPGYASFRFVKQGSLFIISLCDIINTYYKKKVDLLSMLTMVNELMSRKAIEEKWMEIGKQIGNPSHCLRKQIFFNEGLDE